MHVSTNATTDEGTIATEVASAIVTAATLLTEAMVLTATTTFIKKHNDLKRRGRDRTGGATQTHTRQTENRRASRRPTGIRRKLFLISDINCYY